jgi:pimeloyl-ACP methyl ester carboxylesterase
MLLMTVCQEATSQIINVDGSAVRVLIQGPSVGRHPLVLINGLGARLEMWRSFGSELPDRQLVMFDLPGTSGTAAETFPLSMAGLAEWSTKLLDAIGIELADILGYSWGGVLAQQIARDAPSRIRSLTLAGTNFGFACSALPALNLSQLTSAPGLGSDDPLELLVAATGGIGRDPVALMTAFNPVTSSIDGSFRQLYALIGWTSLPWLHELHLPTLVLAGDDDPFIPTMSTKALADAIAGARLSLIPGGGHLLPINQPAKLANVVRQFLDDL